MPRRVNWAFSWLCSPVTSGNVCVGWNYWMDVLKIPLCEEWVSNQNVIFISNAIDIIHFWHPQVLKCALEFFLSMRQCELLELWKVWRWYQHRVCDNSLEAIRLLYIL